MKLKKLAAAVSLACVSSLAISAPVVNWIDWSSTSSGTLNIAPNTINVSMTGAPIGLSNGDYYYNNAATGGTAVTGTYAGLMPSDMIQVNGASTFTLTFSSAILNPYIALVSVGQGGYPVTYSFGAPVSVLSAGGNYWGYSGYTVNGNNFTGYEYNGILQLQGSYSSISFSTAPGENWHGFNIGSAAVANAVPEPETYAMMLAGLGLLGGLARRRKNKTQ